MEFEFERKAMKNEPCPKDLDIIDTAIYMALRCLYSMYRHGLISREKAAEEKKTIVFNMEKEKSKLDFLNRESEALKNKIEEASGRYKNDPTIENADKLYAAFYNLPDDWRNKNE